MKNFNWIAGIIFLLLLQQTEAQAALVLVNQVGYPTSAAKYVFTDQQADSFWVVSTAGRQRVFSEKLILHKSNDPSTGLTIYRGEFTPLNLPGEYVIEISGGLQSAVFAVNDSVYTDVYDKSLKALYFQRCGVELKSDFAGVYKHAICHSVDGLFHSTADSSGYMQAKGGWHDAGDFGKYVVPGAVAAAQLLMTYEYFPEKSGLDHLNIPESGNQIPDILDEARFELEWLLKMQRKNGAVFFKVTPKQFAGFIMPNKDMSTRYIYQPSSTATADFAAIMSRAARQFASYDSSFAQTCLSAAEKAWKYLAANPDIFPAGGFKNPDDTGTGEYGDGNDADERLWAAAELFLTTGGSAYHDYYLSHFNKVELFTRTMSWSSVAAMANLTYLMGERNGMSASTKTQLQTALLNYCQNLINERNSSGLHVLLKQGEYNWGCNSAAMNKAILLIFAYELSGNQVFRNVALDQLHYILGVNAHTMTFVSGVGERSPMNPHHRPSASDGITAPVPGMLAGGANQYLQDDVLKSNFNSSTPPALCYIDHLGSYASNEIAVYWNSPLIFVAAYFLEHLQTSIREGGFGAIPKSIDLQQNYPNPFNGSTVLRMNLPNQEKIALKIFDASGQMIFLDRLGALARGEFSYQWQPPRGLSSGVYFVFAEGASRSSVRKMVYLK